MLRLGRLLARPYAPLLISAAVLYGLLHGARQLSTTKSGGEPSSRYPVDPAYRFSVDPSVPPPSWGLNIVAFSGALTAPSGASALRDAYAAWAPRAASALAGTGAFVYPFSALHVTLSNPAPSTHAGHGAWSDAEKRALAGAWAGALAPCAPRAPFPLVFQRPRLGPGGVGLFEVEDPTGAVRRARECVANLRAGSAALTHLGKTPDIVHATVMRFAAPRAEGVGDAEVEARWAAAAAAWAGGITVISDGFFLVRGNEVAALTEADPWRAVEGRYHPAAG